MMNLGKAIDHKIVIEVKRTYPNNTTEIIRRDTYSGYSIYGFNFDYDVSIDR